MVYIPLSRHRLSRIVSSQSLVSSSIEIHWLSPVVHYHALSSITLLFFTRSLPRSVEHSIRSSLSSSPRKSAPKLLAQDAPFKQTPSTCSNSLSLPASSSLGSYSGVLGNDVCVRTPWCWPSSNSVQVAEKVDRGHGMPDGWTCVVQDSWFSQCLPSRRTCSCSGSLGTMYVSNPMMLVQL